MNKANTILPKNKTCSNCVRFDRCKRLIGLIGNEDHCDWVPSAFILQKQEIKKPKKLTKTITIQKLIHLTIVNSPKIPVINDEGMRKRWVGIGWVDEGALLGDEVELIRK